MNSTENFKSLEFSTLLKINRDEFINIIKNSPQDFETFMQLKDSIGVNMNFKLL